MSRIYDNKPLSSLTVDNVVWKGNWSPESYKCGNGVLIEGVIKGRSRHSLVDSTAKKVRYAVFYVAVRRAHRRQFTSAGVEVEPNFSETEKVRTGFLNSSYKTVAKGSDDTLTFPELVKLVQPEELHRVTDRHNVANCLALWTEESSLEGVEIGVDDTVRVRTHGNSLFIESIAKIEVETASTTVRNFTGGEQVGSSWTDKIMAVKSSLGSEPEQPTSSQPGDCAADDEWGD